MERRIDRRSFTASKRSDERSVIDHGNRLDGKLKAARQLNDRDRPHRRRVGKELSEQLVEGRKRGRVRDEAGDLDDSRESTPGILEHCREIRDRLPRLWKPVIRRSLVDLDPLRTLQPVVQVGLRAAVAQGLTIISRRTPISRGPIPRRVRAPASSFSRHLPCRSTAATATPSCRAVRPSAWLPTRWNSNRKMPGITRWGRRRSCCAAA